ncbi:MAG: EAL domain-containing protein [Stigonema ocellatum SAG 48.90 = DSM 106950]|nr:EAL domain-containing protein [Stigonema ocellatum SAG 48.90 = DSM 106950]
MNSQQPLTSKRHILVVNSPPHNLRLLTTMLTEHGYQVRKVINGDMALKVASNAPPDLIFIDILMPNINGYEVCLQLKANEKTQKIPIIFISNLEEVLDKVKALKLGGIDYINNPFNIEEVLARIENQLSLHRREIIAYQQLQNQLRHDPLTNLPNRTLFMESLEQATRRAKEESDYQFAVLFLDCDRFKSINNSLGHSVGDELLIALARRIKTSLSSVDTLARLDSDEFTILIENIADINSATLVAERILEKLSIPFQLSRYEVFISVSIGIALGNIDNNKSENMLWDAETAMYRAKALGKSRYHIFDIDMHQEALQLLQLENDLRRAVEREEFIIYYQPIVSLITGKITGFEALVRWQHPTRGMVFPTEFIPVAEETGLITAIDTWVLREACRQLRTWQIKNVTSEPLSISVNLSARLFSQPNLIQKIDNILEETQLHAQSLKLEITESAIMENSDSATRIIHELKKRPIQLCIDDFGTGYSSLSYLHNFPVNTLKIDKSFINLMQDNPKNGGLVPMIINIAYTMGMSVVAEGVETLDQLAWLRNLNCDFGQGYLFSKPLEAELVLNLIAAAPRW